MKFPSSRCSATRKSPPIAPACEPKERRDGAPIGVLAIQFDWQSQARAIVQGIRLGADDKARVLLTDADFRVTAASDGEGLLIERLSLETGGRSSGFYYDKSGALVAFHSTPGYETYKGLGWYGVILAPPA